MTGLVPPRFADPLARRIADVCDPVAILLFGSWAKDMANRYSDVDLIVMLPHSPTAALRRAIVDTLGCVPMKVDLLLWTERDVAAARSNPHGFEASALSGAIVLLGGLPTPARRVYAFSPERT